jgi:hypothetical protein
MASPPQGAAETGRQLWFSPPDRQTALGMRALAARLGAVPGDPEQVDQDPGVPPYRSGSAAMPSINC